MDRDLLRLLLLLIFVRLLASATVPATVRSRHDGRERTSRSSVRDVTGPLAGPSAPAHARDSELLLLPAGGGPARGRRTRRGGRGRPRGRRAGRRHRRGEHQRGEGGRGDMCFAVLNIRSLKPKILSLRHDLSFFALIYVF